MPRKTPSQMVSAYDNEPEPSKPFQSENAEPTTSEQPKSPRDNEDRSKDKPSTLTVREVTGDIFAAPENSVLIHACNCFGSWGAGIAAAFKKQYPKAFKSYRDFCVNSPSGMAQAGTALLIRPVDGPQRHYIGCLFTSMSVGRKKDPPDVILKNTGPAMADLLRQIAQESKDGGGVGELRMCQINSGLFAVPWAGTLDAITNLELAPDMPTQVTVFAKP